MSHIIPFLLTAARRSGTIHVMGDSHAGFHVSDESVNGNSWGAMFGPYADGQSAIAAAYALNDGQCAVEVCDAARCDVPAAAPFDRGEF